MFSIIISSYKRHELVGLMLDELLAQDISLNVVNEVIVVDSNSCKLVNNMVNKYSNLDSRVQLVHSDINSLSSRRNLGIKKATSEFLVFLDDDCLPESGYLIELLRTARLHQPNTIWSGRVRFSSQLVRSSNYYRYRESCHSHETKFNDCVEPKYFVAMNFMANRNELLGRSLSFDPAYLGYGFEDTDFSIRAVMLGFQHKQFDASIIHMEPMGNIIKFSEKFYRCAKDGAPIFFSNFPDVDLGLASRFEPLSNYKYGYPIRVLFKLLSNNLFRKIIIYYLIITDRYKILYSRFLFRYVLFSASQSGVAKRYDRISVEQVNSKGWYGN